MESNNMIITLISPLQRKWCLWEYLHGVKTLFKANPDVTFRWIIHDNSKNKRFHKVIEKETNKIRSENPNIDTFIHHINDKSYALADAKDRGNVGEMMVDIYNTAFGLADWESDYGMIIEDDVLVTQTNALSLMLEAMTEDTGTVTACSFNRVVLAHSNNGKITTQHWKFQDHNGKEMATQIEPQSSGIEEVEMSAQSFWLARFDLIKRLGFAHHEKIQGADRGWCLRTKDLGYKTKVVWDVKARHYYISLDGRMDYINYMKKDVEIAPETKYVRVQLDHPNIVFVTVKETMTDEEIEKLYKYKPLKIKII